LDKHADFQKNITQISMSFLDNIIQKTNPKNKHALWAL